MLQRVHNVDQMRCTWSVTGALPVTKDNLCPLPKLVFDVVNGPLIKPTINPP
jgi:hypothetical protein